MSICKTMGISLLAEPTPGGRQLHQVRQSNHYDIIITRIEGE